MRKIILIIAALVLGSVCAEAQLSLNKTISDGMVLQQQSFSRIWGKAPAGKNVAVTTSWNGKTYSCRATSDGKWELKVSTPAASYRNYQISVSCGSERKVVRDVLIGEVWMASGQSNMEMPVRGFYDCPVEGSQQVIAAAATPDRIRMLTVDIYQPLEPQDDIFSTRGWEKAGPQTVAGMSATAYFFARQLNASLDVPVGIISFARGGSRVEGWVPEETARKWGEEIPAEVSKSHNYNEASTMYNGMEQPVKGYTSKGFIWYQGCSNIGGHKVFVERMTELVRQWRSDWGDDDNRMPFYMVEIAPYIYKPAGHQVAALLRKAQHDAAKAIPNSGIVVTNDLVYSYERDNIHPCRKQEVGQRLAYLALHRNYGFEALACDSPEAIEAYIPEGKAGEIRVRLSNCPNGTNRWLEIKGLEVCGSEKVWKPVHYAYFEWDEHALSIRCEGVFDPCEVRYGWGDFKPGNLANAEGLGVVPFHIKVKKKTSK